MSEYQRISKTVHSFAHLQAPRITCPPSPSPKLCSVLTSVAPPGGLFSLSRERAGASPSQRRHLCSTLKWDFFLVERQQEHPQVKRNINLVYGGGSIGLMKTVAQLVQDNGGHVVGVIPRALMPKEICGATFGDLVAVDDMHQPKAEMARRLDAFIALLGGTFECRRLLRSNACFV